MNEATNEATREVGGGSYDPKAQLHEWYEQGSVATIGAVVGENVRRLREVAPLTQHELASKWRRLGLSWTRTKLAALERGERARVDLGELPLMAWALLASPLDLLAGEGLVRLEPTAMMTTREELRAMLSGKKPAGKSPFRLDDLEGDATSRKTLESALTEADAELAKRLTFTLHRPVSVADVFRVADTLFEGRTVTEERDRRTAELGDMTAAARQAHRGHVTRELARQVEDVIRHERTGHKGNR